MRRERKEGRKCFYLTTHSTHFYLRLYGVRHIVKDHSNSDKGNPLPPHRLLFPISSKGSFICTILCHKLCPVSPQNSKNDGVWTLFVVRLTILVTIESVSMFIFTMSEGRNHLFNDTFKNFFYMESDIGRKLLQPHGLLFTNSSKGSFICTIPQTGQHITRPLLHQSWSTDRNNK